MEVLPEDCIVQILSFMMPEEVCRLAAVSRTFRSAVNSNVLWKEFLPRKWERMVSRALEPPPAVLTALSYKDLYIRLLGHGVHFNHPPFPAGLICYIVSTRTRHIFLGHVFFSATWEFKPIPDDPLSYLEVTSDLKTEWRDYSIPEVVVLPPFNTTRTLGAPPPPCIKTLTLETRYAIYMVFQLHPYPLGSSFPSPPFRIRFYLSFGMQERQEHILVLNPHLQGMLKNYEERADGWMEVEMTQFTSPCLSSIKISYSLEELPPHHYQDCTVGRKTLEVRPKHDA